MAKWPRILTPKNPQDKAIYPSILTQEMVEVIVERYKRISKKLEQGIKINIILLNNIVYIYNILIRKTYHL